MVLLPGSPAASASNSQSQPNEGISILNDGTTHAQAENFKASGVPLAAGSLKAARARGAFDVALLYGQATGAAAEDPLELNW